FEVCRTVRKFSDVPISFLTSRGDEVDRIVGLELGGDDYIIKPFSTRELLARIKAIRRRNLPAAKVPNESLLRYGPLEIDRAKFRVDFRKKEIRLTAQEFRLLELRLQWSGCVFT